jgi:N,N'-diacetylbacillosaminyl-diphospho-undecaprenol alpha-1,3-N-acetylgalactosaminyltransferase
VRGAPAPGDGEFAAKRFVFMSYLDANLYRFRLPVMKRLVESGAHVSAVAPRSFETDLFAAHGIEYVPFEMRGASINPFADLRVAGRLGRLLTDLRPDLLQTFMLKPNLIGGWVARRADDIRVVSTVTGLGRLYEDGVGVTGRAVRRVADQLMRRAFSEVSAVVFQNTDDRDELLGRGLCREEDARLISSSGVDLDEFSPASVDPGRPAALREEWGIGRDEPVVTMVARLLPSKGVREFAAAADTFRDRARFVLIGPVAKGASRFGGGAVTTEEIADWQRAGTLIAPGVQRNIQEWLAASDVYTLPSYYREGVPRSVLEAMAMELPVVTTDMPGCRETVEHERNGFLIPPRDVVGLVDALGRLLDDAALRRRMGAASRALVERRFDSEAVVDQHFDLYRELLTEQARV